MSVYDANPAALEPSEFAQIVKRSSADELYRLVTGEQRREVLDVVFVRMPGVFRADRAGSLKAVLHWKVGDRPGGGADTYELVIADRTCTLSPAPDRSATLELSIGAVDFLKMVTGNANPIALFMLGKLKTKGDVGLTARIPNLFDVPRA
ncbi:SCP2 sterol-binding domain-containing protein [Dactylosporangium sp. NPDC049525]|uniref:SCP2 sterol-binding domain-containing protein n=1 Tax=Dactylosporangium sp. NPDC049525 TaxID=3154730 RepID=UPI00341EC607